MHTGKEIGQGTITDSSSYTTRISNRKRMKILIWRDGVCVCPMREVELCRLIELTREAEKDFFISSPDSNQVAG